MHSSEVLKNFEEKNDLMTFRQEIKLSEPPKFIRNISKKNIHSKFENKKSNSIESKERNRKRNA